MPPSPQPKQKSPQRTRCQRLIGDDLDRCFYCHGSHVTREGKRSKKSELFPVFCDDATGKANFGFLSKYKKGASIPTGNTEFNLSAGDLNFHSESYEWLVVNQNGTNAQFKGAGDINGGGGYKFMLWAGDGAPDTFCIKIWYEDSSEVVVYDNGFGGYGIISYMKFFH